MLFGPSIQGFAKFSVKERLRFRCLTGFPSGHKSVVCEKVPPALRISSFGISGCFGQQAFEIHRVAATGFIFPGAMVPSRLYQLRAVPSHYHQILFATFSSCGCFFTVSAKPPPSRSHHLIGFVRCRYLPSHRFDQVSIASPLPPSRCMPSLAASSADLVLGGLRHQTYSSASVMR